MIASVRHPYTKYGRCVCPHSIPSPAATTSLVPYAGKAISVVQSWPTIVLSQTRGLIAFSGCPRGNIVYTRFSAALSGTTCHFDTHPRRSTAMQCFIRRRRELTRQEPARPPSGQNKRSLLSCRLLHSLAIVLLSPLPQ